VKPVQNEHQYLPFVDGLRAIAILTVVAFHIGMPGLPGGFVGVDVFFVISGFLIVNQIRQDLEAGRFSIVSFYSRRALRILPPFLIVLWVVCLIVPPFLPSPRVLGEFVWSAVAAPLMLANVVFYWRQGYFDTGATEKPLLHTWTLSVEEQFYLVAPLALLLVFRLGKGKFGGKALAIAIVLAALSLAGSVRYTSTTGANAAFYLAQWRAWEFIAGGVIGGALVANVARLPRPAVEALGWLGLAAIAVAVIFFDHNTPFPSWRAAIPVAGAMLVILAGSAQPQISAARLLALPAMVAIGLVSYGWYLWHWPILSLMHISRFGDTSLVAKLLGGGLLAFVLAWLSYRFVELPIRQWRRTGGVKRPTRIVAAGVALCAATAAIGGLAVHAQQLWSRSMVTARYGIEGKGVLDNGCRLWGARSLPASCLQERPGILMGDSYADALSGTLTRSFAGHGQRLITLAQGNCDPVLFAPSLRDRFKRHSCANLIGPFEQLLVKPSPLRFVIVSSAWWHGNGPIDLMSEVLPQFDLTHVRVLLMGPVPSFDANILDCVVVSDWYRTGRDGCTRPRADVEKERAPILPALKATAERLPNVRYIDPIDVFCDSTTCRPFNGNQVFYRDRSHVTPLGAERILDRFASEFRWLGASE
jgi:peptidoglycan/LPS O-acetylase OafA/YrhL